MGVTFSSSEKVDPAFADCFEVLSVPYPGVELFSQFRDHSFNVEVGETILCFRTMIVVVSCIHYRCYLVLALALGWLSFSFVFSVVFLSFVLLSLSFLGFVIFSPSCYSSLCSLTCSSPSCCLSVFSLLCRICIMIGVLLLNDSALSVDARLFPFSWDEVQSFDVLALTKHYLALLLRVILDPFRHSCLHCISGWDRTPLFVSLLRLVCGRMARCIVLVCGATSLSHYSL